MVAATINWIEQHQATVDLAKWVALLVAAWLSGAFSYFQRYRRKPRLEVATTASFVFLERPTDPAGNPDPVRAAFVINASIVNASNEKIVLDHFELSYRCVSFWRSYRQRILRIAFPTWPRKRLGNGVKYMGVWFTELPDEPVQLSPVRETLESRDASGGYLLFTSFTWGDWNPRVTGDAIRIRLKAKLTSQQWLTSCVDLRVLTDASHVDEFCPGLVEHVAHESTWNHDLSIRR